jgi:hypothetical protein
MSSGGRLCRMSVVLWVALLSAGGDDSRAAPSAREAVRVRASEAFAPCLRPALDAFSRESGVPTVLDVREPDPPGDADVVVGDDVELTRVLEGGSADLGSSFDLGYLPWVFVVPKGAPVEVSAAVADAGWLYVLGGRVGREARAALGSRLPEGRVRVSRDPQELRGASYALVPRSLAGSGEQRPAGVRPLVAVAAAVSGTPHAAEAARLLAFLKSARGLALLAPFLSQTSAPEPQAAAAADAHAVAVVDWWLPQCTLDHNGYNDPQQVVGPPDALSLGIKDQYKGFMSLGQGGFVTVDLGLTVIDGPGADVRVFQSVSNEPVTLYAAGKPAGPFVLVGLRTPCGVRSPGLFSNHCDFDLHDAAIAEARYLKIEDGEIYPCLKGGTITEGADIDAVQILNQKS